MEMEVLAPLQRLAELCLGLVVALEDDQVVDAVLPLVLFLAEDLLEDNDGGSWALARPSSMPVRRPQGETAMTCGEDGAGRRLDEL
jgi:hypothetical protein